MHEPKTKRKRKKKTLPWSQTTCKASVIMTRTDNSGFLSHLSETLRRWRGKNRIKVAVLLKCRSRYLEGVFLHPTSTDWLVFSLPVTRPTSISVLNSRTRFITWIIKSGNHASFADEDRSLFLWSKAGQGYILQGTWCTPQPCGIKLHKPKTYKYWSQRDQQSCCKSSAGNSCKRPCVFSNLFSCNWGESTRAVTAVGRGGVHSFMEEGLTTAGLTQAAENLEANGMSLRVEVCTTPVV